MSGTPLLSSPPSERMALVSLPQQQQQQQQHLQPPPPEQALSSPTASQLVQQTPLVYPPALAKHQAVVADRDLFYDTLNKFHAALGTRLMIPTIGGKELDLHLLYVEVSTRGGLEQVIKERKWKEVTVVFNFPPTTTSASYVLRKYYITLLHHYEQVYFFGVQGQLVPPPATLPVPSPGHPPSTDNGFGNHAVEEAEPVVKRRRRRVIDPARLYGVDLGASVGHSVSGVIDGKFEHGYLVTVTVGTEKLRGVLYHMPSGSLTPQFAAVPGMASGIGFDGIRKRRRRRRKDEMPKKDPNAPKPNRSGYNFFFQEQHMRLKALHPDKDKEISRMIGELWNKQTEEERAVYQERGVKDKERYKREIEEYRERLKSEAHYEGSAAGIVDLPMQLEMDSQDQNEKLDHQAHAVAKGASHAKVVKEENAKCDVSEKNGPELNKLEEERCPGPTYEHGGNG